MARRTIDVAGNSWEVASTGRVTQYARDEFGITFRRVGGTTPELFAAGRKSRAFYREAVARFGPGDWSTILEFETPGGKLSITKRKLALHLPLHEMRHWAQIARTVREHDLAPPGKHDLMFSEVIK